MTKLCVPNVIKRVNLQVYNFLMRLNETRNVLWHESCKCVCKLNSSVCNNKQIWNDDTCRCDCNEDFVGIINCTKGYTWYPSTCECQCDTWCKPGQYLDLENKFLALENKLTQKGDTINENERGLSIFRSFFFYLQQNHLVYECKVDSFTFDNKKMLKWKSTGIFNYSDYYSMKGIENTKKEMAILKNDEKLYVYLQDNHFQQNNVLTSNNDQVLNKNVVNIYIVYKLDPLVSTRDKSYTIQNALFGAMQINKNATGNDKNNYKGYGICFDGRIEFGHTITEGGRAHTTDARNVLIFGADMSFSIHATNRANHIYILWVLALRKVLMILQYMQKRTFTETLKILVKNLH